MSVTVDIRFERIAEEFNPPAPKPEPRKPSRQASQRPLSATEAITRVEPQWDTLSVRVCIDQDQKFGDSEVEAYVRREIVAALTNAIAKYVTVETADRFDTLQTEYIGSVHVAKTRPRRGSSYVTFTDPMLPYEV